MRKFCTTLGAEESRLIGRGHGNVQHKWVETETIDGTVVARSTQRKRKKIVRYEGVVSNNKSSCTFVATPLTGTACKRCMDDDSRPPSPLRFLIGTLTTSSIHSLEHTLNFRFFYVRPRPHCMVAGVVRCIQNRCLYAIW